MKSSNRKSYDQDSKKIKAMERRFYQAISEMQKLDELAIELNSWEERFGHMGIAMPSIYEIEQRQRERLITAMWYNKTLHIKDAEVDAYLQWKVEVLSTM